MTTAKLRAPVLSGLHELLQPLGLRKAASAFAKAGEDVVHLIEVQGSSASTKERVRFTVNVGVFANELAAAWCANDKPSIAGAHWRERLGLLSPEAKDLWWEACTLQEAESIATEVVVRVKEYALPALAELPNLDAFVRSWEQGRCQGITEYQRKQYLNQLDRKPLQGV